MGIQQKLHTKLVQKLILTPSLQQAIKLLPMSTLELSDLLNQEMVENPMLEEVPTEDLQPAEAAAPEQKSEPEQQPNKTDTWDDQDYEYFFGDYLDDGYRPRAPQEVKELPPIENTLSTASSLADHLMWQLSMQTDDPLIREIGSAIIGNLDDDGYLVASFEELAEMGSWPVADVERALRLVQSFDPVGVAARDLQECLLLQLRHLGLEGTPTEKVVTDHLRLLQNHQVIGNHLFGGRAFEAKVPQLQQQAFLEIACRNADRIEALHQAQRALDIGHGPRAHFRELFERRHQVP